MKHQYCAATLCAALSLALPVHAAGDAKPVDDGTNPTKLNTMAEGRYEYVELQNGFYSSTLRLGYTHPLGAKRDYNIRFRLPITAVDTLGNHRHDIGDASVQMTHVFGLTKTHGYVVQGELIFDTAARPELGAGKEVFKGSFIYVMGMKDGSLFAPAAVHSISVAGDSNRADINSTTFDFYYVPKLKAKSKGYLMTLDPALTFDWENKREFASLAVTMGKVLGPAFGGNGVAFIKPSVFAGSDRPGDWGIEVGYKVIGF